MIAELAVLLGVKHFEQRAGWIAAIVRAELAQASLVLRQETLGGRDEAADSRAIDAMHARVNFIDEQYDMLQERTP